MERKDASIVISTILFYNTVGTISIALQLLFAGRVSDFLIALLTSVYWLLLLIFSVIWSFLADNLGRRKEILCLTNLSMGVVILAFLLFQDYTSAFIIRALMGIFSGAYLPIALAILLDDTPKEKLGRKSSLFNISRSLGFLFSSYMTTILLLIFDVQSLFIFSSLAVSTTALLISLIKTSRKKEVRRIELKVPGKGFIRNNNAHLLVIALTLRHINIMGIISLIFVYMISKGIPDYLVGFISSFNLLMQIVLMYPFGYLADKVGRKPIFLLGFLFSIIVPLAFYSAENVWEFSISFALIGISFSALISGTSPFLRDIAPPGRESEALSFLNVARGIGSVIGPMLVGYVATYFGYNTMFIVISIISTIGFILSLFVKETLRSRI